MAKFETFFCAMMFGLTNALLVAVAMDPASPATLAQPAAIAAAATQSPPAV